MKFIYIYTCRSRGNLSPLGYVTENDYCRYSMETSIVSFSYLRSRRKWIHTTTTRQGRFTDIQSESGPSPFQPLTLLLVSWRTLWTYTSLLRLCISFYLVFNQCTSCSRAEQSRRTIILLFVTIEFPAKKNLMLLYFGRTKKKINLKQSVKTKKENGFIKKFRKLKGYRVIENKFVLNVRIKRKIKNFVMCNRYRTNAILICAPIGCSFTHVRRRSVLNRSRTEIGLTIFFRCAWTYTLKNNNFISLSTWTRTHRALSDSD